MENFSDKQNEIFGKLFEEVKKMHPTYQTVALVMLEMDNENFLKLYNDPDNKIIGDSADIELVHLRAKNNNQ